MEEDEKNKKKSNNTLIVAVLVAIMFGGAGFLGGMQYQKSKRPAFFTAQTQNGQRFNGREGRMGVNNFRPVNGEITSVDGNTITIKSPDGSSKNIVYADSTKVNKTSEGAKDDLKVGEQIMVIGTESSDGTVTAQNISVGGNFFRFGTNGNQPE